MAGTWTTLIKILKPVFAGLGIAYVVTAFVDRPEPVHFQIENPFAAEQTAIVEPYKDVVEEKNIMKLGSPLSAVATETVPATNPLAPLSPGEESATAGPADPGTEAANGTVRGGVQEPNQP